MTATMEQQTGTAKRLVDYTKQDGLAIIALNDPPANTYTYEMNRQLDDAILDARMDDSVYVIILRGAGLRDLWEPIAWLTFYTVLIIGLAVARFRKTAD